MMYREIRGRSSLFLINKSGRTLAEQNACQAILPKITLRTADGTSAQNAPALEQLGFYIVAKSYNKFCLFGIVNSTTIQWIIVII